MENYKVLIKNPLEVGRFKSVDGTLSVESPTDKESKRIENAIKNGIIEKVGQEVKKIEIDLSLSDEEIMKSFTVDDLKKFCKDSEFKGYSKLNQEELINFIRENTKEA